MQSRRLAPPPSEDSQPNESINKRGRGLPPVVVPTALPHRGGAARGHGVPRPLVHTHLQGGAGSSGASITSGIHNQPATRGNKDWRANLTAAQATPRHGNGVPRIDLRTKATSTPNTFVRTVPPPPRPRRIHVVSPPLQPSPLRQPSPPRPETPPLKRRKLADQHSPPSPGLSSTSAVRPPTVKREHSSPASPRSPPPTRSGCSRYAYPPQCLKPVFNKDGTLTSGDRDYIDQRRAWVQQEIRTLRAVGAPEGLVTGKFRFRDDGMTIDWTTKEPVRPADLSSRAEQVQILAKSQAQSQSHAPPPPAPPPPPPLKSPQKNASARMHAGPKPSPRSLPTVEVIDVDALSSDKESVDDSEEDSGDDEDQLEEEDEDVSAEEVNDDNRAAFEHVEEEEEDDSDIVILEPERQASRRASPVAYPPAPPVTYVDHSENLATNETPGSHSPPPRPGDMVAQKTIAPTIPADVSTKTDDEIGARAETGACAFLTRYVRAFDIDGAEGVLPAYAADALFSCRGVHAGGLAHGHAAVRVGLSAVRKALCFGGGAVADVAYDVVACGSGDAEVLLVCRGRVVRAGTGRTRAWLDQSFVLRWRKVANENASEEWGMAVVCHQMAVRDLLPSEGI